MDSFLPVFYIISKHIQKLIGVDESYADVVNSLHQAAPKTSGMSCSRAPGRSPVGTEIVCKCQ